MNRVLTQIIITSTLIATGSAVVMAQPATGFAAPRAGGIDSPYWQTVTITEIMAHPAKVDSASGQWLELQNLTETPVNMQGIVLMSTSSDGFHVIIPATELILAPGQILLIGSRLDQEVNGRVPVDYSYGNDFPLNPVSDVILLMRDGKLVDYVSYGGGGIQIEKGYSLSLEPGAVDVPNWCLARIPYGLGDFGTPGRANTYCDDDLDSFSEDEGDCDDTNPVVKPGGTESCNGLDDNCNSLTDEEVSPPTGTCPDKGVCAAIVPLCEGTSGFICPDTPGWEIDDETMCDHLDNDCDGTTDENMTFNGLALDAMCNAPGECGKGTVVCSSTTLRPTCSTLPDGTEPGSSSEKCDKKDNDCDGFTDEGFHINDLCSAGLGICLRNGVIECDGTSKSRCNAIPGNADTELCGDRLDNDCDGFTDEGFPVGEACSAGRGACLSVSKFVCSRSLLDVECAAVEGTPSNEICNDQIDDDCDGETDELECEKPSAGCSINSINANSTPISLIILALALVMTLAVARTISRKKTCTTSYPDNNG
jgi:hypothetical protein